MDGRRERWQALTHRGTNGKLNSLSGRIFGRAGAVSPLWWVKCIPCWRMNRGVEMLLVTSNDTGRSAPLASVKWVGVEAASSSSAASIHYAPSFFHPSWEEAKHGRVLFYPSLFPQHREPVTGAGKWLVALRESGIIFLLSLLFIQWVYAAFAKLLLEMFSRGCFCKRHEARVCSPAVASRRGIGSMCSGFLVDIWHFSIETSLSCSQAWRIRRNERRNETNTTQESVAHSVSLWWAEQGF